MGYTENAAPAPYHPDDALQAACEGATAPPPPTPPVCPRCALPQDRYPTLYPQTWVLLEPGITVASHRVQPRRRWLITPDGIAWNTWDAEPIPGSRCRISHRSVCPWSAADDLWPWGTALRRENARRAQRLFNLPGRG
ncbi:MULTISPECIES: DUF6083 domain-containing protein [unclassified Streptomyces]|uniref:DUF6083 domain-containing protein n=1 Tax=unclassified Streptomyces TaxID=2593676 RepID=UPI00093CD5C0|nr:DUF6083 domain-containing protein [Streptomyces sp. TSRI0281]OKI48603.1 hypothetical protein A6A29_06350 [Streptomyces sp. TSRI0281]